MKIHIALLALAASFQSVALATDLVVDRVVIMKHPIPTPYYAAMSLKVGRVQSSFHEAKKAYGTGGIHGSQVEIQPKLVVKNVQPHTWADFTLRLDAKDSIVATQDASRSHTGHFEILPGSHDNIFIPQLHNPSFAYKIFWHAQ